MGCEGRGLGGYVPCHSEPPHASDLSSTSQEVSWCFPLSDSSGWAYVCGRDSTGVAVDALGRKAWWSPVWSSPARGTTACAAAVPGAGQLAVANCCSDDSTHHRAQSHSDSQARCRVASSPRKCWMPPALDCRGQNISPMRTAAAALEVRRSHKSSHDHLLRAPVLHCSSTVPAHVCCLQMLTGMPA